MHCAALRCAAPRDATTHSKYTLVYPQLLEACSVGLQVGVNQRVHHIVQLETPLLDETKNGLHTR